MDNKIGGENHFPTLSDLYALSKIDIETYEKSCVLLEYKTGTNQEVLDNLPFYRFNNKMIFLNQIIEEEKKTENGESTPNQDDVMNNAKNMMHSIKMPNIKIPK